MNELSVQGVNRLFVLTFNALADITGHLRYYLLTLKVENYNNMINGINVFCKPIKNNVRTYENIRKITTAQGDDWSTGCLLDYSYFQNQSEMIGTDLSKHQKLDSNPKTIQQINFTENLSGNSTILMFFITEEAKERN